MWKTLPGQYSSLRRIDKYAVADSIFVDNSEKPAPVYILQMTINVKDYKLNGGLDKGLRQDAHIRNVLDDVKLFDSPLCDHNICQAIFKCNKEYKYG